MKHIQIELTEEEDEILRVFMLLVDENNKKKALKKLIKESKNIPKIKQVLKIKNSKIKNEKI